MTGDEIAMTYGSYLENRGLLPLGDEDLDTQGFLFEREDGALVWQPKHLTFGDALEAVKQGKRIARTGWNGKGMWLILIHPGNAMHSSSMGSFDMQPCIGMKTANNLMQPGWLASQNDMLAEDWKILA